MARWQALLAIFNFTIACIKGKDNSLPDFLYREFLQRNAKDVRQISVKVIEKLSSTWELVSSTSTEQSIESVHPPLKSIKYKEVTTVPLKNDTLFK